MDKTLAGIQHLHQLLLAGSDTALQQPWKALNDQMYLVVTYRRRKIVVYSISNAIYYERVVVTNCFLVP